MDRIEYLKIYIFISGLVLFSSAGYLFSYRKNTIFQSRFYINLFFSALNSVIILFVLKIIFFRNYLFESEPSYGLLSYTNWSWGLKFILGFLILDMMIYWQHRLFHKVPILWRLHRLHHSDTDFDTSTGLRFHPFEALISLFNRLLIVYIFGISFMTLVAFEIVLNFASMFNHSNFALPKSVELSLRNYIITPDLHRIHHSVDLRDSNHNFGFSITLWDFIFRSYRPKSKLSFKTDNIGVLGYQKPEKQSLLALLLQPFN